MQTIYKKYKERFIEISGKNRSLFTKSIIKKHTYDLGAILENFDSDDFYDFLWQQKRHFTVINEKISKKIIKINVKTQPKEVDFVYESDLPLVQTKVPTSDHTAFLSRQLTDIKYLKREIEEIQNDTGKYDLYVGFPYVFGKISSDTPVKAPLLLFPVKINIEVDCVTIEHIDNQPVIINKSFILAYCKEHGLKTDNLIQEFDPQSENSFKNIYEVVDYLNNNGFKIRYQKRKGLTAFDPVKEITFDTLELKNMAVLGRFPLANPIYNDYLRLEKYNLSTASIDLLLQGKTKKQKNKNKIPVSYTMNELDYSQENAIEKVNSANNIVIYGPPGTGKSQTIVNIISDALCKNKKVLVVSQKQAALDVVFSRLGKLNSKAMLIPDPEKYKAMFFDRIKQMHTKLIRDNTEENQKQYQNYEVNINKELSILTKISDTLFSKNDFGLSLQEMYAKSYNIGKDSKDYLLYEAMLKTNIVDKNYPQLAENIKYINDKNIAKLFVKKQELVRANPMIVHLKNDLDMHQLKEAHAFLNRIIDNASPPFDFSKYPRSRYLTTFYLEKAAPNRAAIERIADMLTKIEHPELAQAVNMSLFPAFLPVFPLLKYRYNRYRKDINIDLNIALKALTDYEMKFSGLSVVLDDDGYALAIGGVLNGNYELLKNLLSALENYVVIRDMNKVLSELNDDIKEILDYSYNLSDKTIQGFANIINNVLPIRIYHEIIKNDKYIENALSDIVNFDSMRQRILQLKSDQRELTINLALDRFSSEYAAYFDTNAQSKDYLYQISKQRALWPIRRMIEFFEEYLFRLFPCWLLSPQTVSSIFPLKTAMFDLVVFDEASQMFIENALPTIYRGNNIVVAGDSKQLRPSSTFVKRYLADDSFDYNLDLSTQAALEVESLLDLATAKYTPVNLVYHYRSAFSELIDFSNMAFYENKLQIAPNITLRTDNRPIERIKVKGMWQNRHNHEEAVAVVKLLRSILRDREYNETIGIVTFNNEQKEYIEDILDAEADKIAVFRRQLYNERNRIEEGENHSLFVKNLENVQGDERDIIIFCIGYAKNENDKVVAQFGSLSTEGGENRLNVAITRARKKVYVITSIEPEELDKVATTKNSGPKLLKKYLQYARAVSANDNLEIAKVLSTFDSHSKDTSPYGAYEQQIKQGLEQMGYTVYTNLGNTYYKLSLGVFDKELNRFVLGIECDYQAYKSSENVLERDVYRIKFLEKRGWRVVRVWSRDWWQSRKKVLENLASIIEKERKILQKAV